MSGAAEQRPVLQREDLERLRRCSARAVPRRGWSAPSGPSAALNSNRSMPKVSGRGRRSSSIRSPIQNSGSVTAAAGDCGVTVVHGLVFAGPAARCAAQSGGQRQADRAVVLQAIGAVVGAGHAGQAMGSWRRHGVHPGQLHLAEIGAPGGTGAGRSRSHRPPAGRSPGTIWTTRSAGSVTAGPRHLHQVLGRGRPDQRRGEIVSTNWTRRSAEVRARSPARP